MFNKPEIKKTTGGVYYENNFGDFTAKVYTPDFTVPADIINYAFETPYIMVFEEKPMSIEDDVAFAKAEGLDAVMKDYAGPVVFFYPTCDGGWKNAAPDLYSKMINESKTGQYHENGLLTSYKFRTREVDGYFIRGAVHRPFVYGVGDAADYIATNLLKRCDGNFLWGPGEVTPAVCTMRGASVMPDLTRDDIVIVSSENSKEFNACLEGKVKNLFIDDNGTFGDEFKDVKYFRRILGGLEKQKDLSKLGMVVEPGFETVKTSAENAGDDAGTTEHRIGYVAYCNKDALVSGDKLPTVFAFHGGGDSAMIIANFSSGWSMVANKYNFLLIAVENHLNSTATETIELIEKLKAKYPIDPERIYGSGFSMGGIKSWDMFQEYPDYFAAVAPMSATTEPGFNVHFQPSPKLNKDVTLPVFYVGGEMSPLPELAKHADKCFERFEYVLKVNKCLKKYNAVYADKNTWENDIWAVNGDTTIKLNSFEKEGRVMTLQLFDSADDKCYTVFGSINDQQHELHYHQCEYAYRFMSSFSRLSDGTLVGGNKEDIVENVFSAEV